MIAGELDPVDWGLPTRGIGPHSHWQQIKAGLIYKDDGSFFLFGLFLSADHRSSFQHSMASSSRWLAGSLNGLLHTVLDGPQKTTAVRRMIADAKFPLDELGDPCRRPDLSSKAKRLGSFVEQPRQLRQLRSR